jgi:long-chain fatty acid transport protein
MITTAFKHLMEQKRLLMKKTNHVLVTVIATLFTAPVVLATNGTNMTGVSAQSVALGGTGVAAYYGAENVIINPALIGKGKGTEFSFGGTLFKPSVSNDGLGGSVMGSASTRANSSADTFVIPSVSLTSRISDTLSFGIGMYGTSGMGVNYKNATGASGNLMSAQSQLQIIRIVPTIAYNTANAGVGFSPIIQYGALDVNYNMGGMGAGAPGVPTGGFTNIGSGVSSDLGYGFTLGGYYDLSKQFTIGAAYTSSIDMKYKNQLSTASAPFATLGMIPTAFSDNLAQPAEIKVGAAYTMGNIMLMGDLKQIRWSEAKGYKDFNWQDQNVIALGLKYSGTGYWLGVGYNKADNPIKAMAANLTTGGTTNGATINMFNNMFFPATTESHFSFGGGYDLTKNVSLDAAVVYAPEVTTTVDTSGITQAMNANMAITSTNTTSHSQIGYTVSVRYKF